MRIIGRDVTKRVRYEYDTITECNNHQSAMAVAGWDFIDNEVLNGKYTAIYSRLVTNGSDEEESGETDE